MIVQFWIDVTEGTEPEPPVVVTNGLVKYLNNFVILNNQLVIL
jgi:hypothetical protein